MCRSDRPEKRSKRADMQKAKQTVTNYGSHIFMESNKMMILLESRRE
ncbi:MAG: hypothetical protein BAJATHORv1_20304 [Candidatus Thorarchaeota archaeon]|nr:MAG: hypothetical protein BAJATHORv1_20304 [Candidatus Thorarchaeota archaeon]